MFPHPVGTTTPSGTPPSVVISSESVGVFLCTGVVRALKVEVLEPLLGINNRLGRKLGDQQQHTDNYNRIREVSPSTCQPPGKIWKTGNFKKTFKNPELIKKFHQQSGDFNRRWVFHSISGATKGGF